MLPSRDGARSLESDRDLAAVEVEREANRNENMSDD